MPWKDSPFYKVAEIWIPPQEFHSLEHLLFDENMTFNPWHRTPEHRPIGGVNRTLRDVMRAIKGIPACAERPAPNQCPLAAAATARMTDGHRSVRVSDRLGDR